jgi:hypothetical protein
MTHERPRTDAPGCTREKRLGLLSQVSGAFPVECQVKDSDPEGSP